MQALRSLRAAAHGVVLAAVLGCTTACGETTRYPVRLDEDLYAASASRRTEAVAVVARERDLDRVPVLIDLLDDPDPGVRLAAGSALRDLTGRDTDYRPWADPEARRAQQALWRTWWEAEGRGRAARETVATAPPPKGVR